MKKVLGIGFSISTTTIGAAVVDAEGNTDFSSVPNKPQKWHGGPSYNQKAIPLKIMNCLRALESREWDFSDPGSLSLDVRQHDMEITDKDARPLIPALSWQWTKTEKWLEKLKAMGLEKTVGPLAERFILPKAATVLDLQPEIRNKINTITTTGDWVVWCLTGFNQLSTSDGLSNGLLCQFSKMKAFEAIRAAGLNPDWVPNPINSDAVIGKVGALISEGFMSEWEPLRQKLSGWEVVASLGDNHAAAVGCGLEPEDTETMVVSFGSSGTTERICSIESVNSLLGNAMMFEFYKNRLLLNMLPDCDVWWKRFRQKYAKVVDVRDLDAMALEATQLRNDLCHVKQEKIAGSGWKEIYPAEWISWPLDKKIASTLLSIVLEMAILTKKMMVEIRNGQPIKRFILAGGLSNSPLVKEAFAVAAEMLSPGAKVLASSLKGPLASKASARGSLINGLVGSGVMGIKTAMKILCPLEIVNLPSKIRKNKIADFFNKNWLVEYYSGE